MPTRAFSRPADPDATRDRLAALARAKVFLSEFNPRVRSETVEIECRYRFVEPSGTTPKFDCTLDDGRRIRVKYGSLELQAEVVTSHLLSTLGFGADNVTMARRVRCYGCPPWPMLVGQAAERLRLGRLLDHVNYDHHRDFEWVSAEWRGGHNEMKFGEQEGWSWHELSAIDPSVGGATRAEVDALRLMAMFLNHWDNKASNHRLICPAAPDSKQAADRAKPVTCDHPLAMMQDMGSTLGPRRVNLEAWSQSPVWTDETKCALSMKHLPHGGGTFEDVRISEEGRRLLADRLLKLTKPQMQAILNDARFENVDGWVAAFERRIDAIARRPPCPSTT
jgi:hypothetical protein